MPSRLVAPLCLLPLLVAVCGITAPAAEKSSAALNRVSEGLKYLSSDDLEGRGVGTDGINAAADYIAGEFKKLGLKTDVVEGGPFQKFKFTVGAKLGEKNGLDLMLPAEKVGQEPAELHLKLDKDFNPMVMSGSGDFDLPLVFVGYGITAKDKKYDSYADVDVKGKAVVILRKIPQQGNPHSPFGGNAQRSEHAPFTRKISNAYQHGAAAVIFVTDVYEVEQQQERMKKAVLATVDRLVGLDQEHKAKKKPSEEEQKEYQQRREKMLAQLMQQGNQLRQTADAVLPFGYGGRVGEGRSIPVLHMRRSVVDRLLKTALGKKLAQLEEAIDKGPKPHSAELKEARLKGAVSINRTEAEIKNVIAVLEGEGPHADETIVIGAHYDHLGMGGIGARDPRKKAVHNGADDNGSGTVALLEVARKIAAAGKPSRRFVFIAFTAEERGLIGSGHYVKNPVVPLEKTVAMLNMDMVGRLRDDKLTVFGTGTAKRFDPLLDELNKQYGFKIARKPSGFGPSDHSSFYAQKIPVLHFFTGTHREYHTPDDDFDTVNLNGIVKVADLVADTALELAKSDAAPQYVQVKSRRPERPTGSRPYFGSIPAFGGTAEGYELQGVAGGSPAEKGGLKGGDVIIKFGESKIGNLEDFDSALRKFKAGDKVPVVVLRDEKEVKLEVILDPPK